MKFEPCVGVGRRAPSFDPLFFSAVVNVNIALKISAASWGRNRGGPGEPKWTEIPEFPGDLADKFLSCGSQESRCRLRASPKRWRFRFPGLPPHPPRRPPIENNCNNGCSYSYKIGSVGVWFGVRKWDRKKRQFQKIPKSMPRHAGATIARPRSPPLSIPLFTLSPVNSFLSFCTGGGRGRGSGRPHGVNMLAKF